MVNNYFLDSNIFLELSIPDEGYFQECENFFENDDIKKTSVRVKHEVDYIMNKRARIIPHLARHFYKKGSKKFEPPYEIDYNTWTFIEDILIAIGTANPLLISRKIREKFSFINKCLKYRFSKISGRLIKESDNQELFEKLELIMCDWRDAWHIVDATEWAMNNTFLIFCSLDRRNITEERIVEQIIACICEYYEWKKHKCPITICHLLDI